MQKVECAAPVRTCESCFQHRFPSHAFQPCMGCACHASDVFYFCGPVACMFLVAQAVSLFPVLDLYGSARHVPEHGPCQLC